MKYMLLLINLIFSVSLLAQEESFPCEEGNPALKQLFETGKMQSLYIHGCQGEGLDGISSSFLKASGTPPAVVEYPEEGMTDDSEYVSWTCKYSAGNLRDENVATAWVEGVKGQGINEVVIVPCLDLQKPVEIWAGYGKSAKLFQYNSRPSKVKLIVIRAKMAGATQYGAVYKELLVIESAEISLADKNGFQPLTIPAFNVETYSDERFQERQEYAYFLGLQLLEVYEGTKWDDTCISEIRNVPPK